MIRKAVFLDRDGVLNKCIVNNKKCFAPKKLKDFKLYPNTENNIKKIKDMNFMIFVVTNQPDIGNKLTNKKVIDKMHLILKKKL
jgi:D-glycero-D-manno-heptose 1,7-bisphosphate phosphatase